METGTFTWLERKHSRLSFLERNSASRALFRAQTQTVFGDALVSNTNGGHDWLENMCNTPETRLLSGLHHWCGIFGLDWKTCTPTELRKAYAKLKPKTVDTVHDIMIDSGLSGMSGLPDEVRNVDPINMIDRLCFTEEKTNKETGVVTTEFKLRGGTIMPSVTVGTCSCCTTDFRLQMLAALNAPRGPSKDYVDMDNMGTENRSNRLSVFAGLKADFGKHVQDNKTRGKPSRSALMALDHLEQSEEFHLSVERGEVPNLASALVWNKSVVLQLVAVDKITVTKRGPVAQVQLILVCKSCVQAIARPNGGHTTSLRNVKTYARYMNPGLVIKGEGKDTNRVRGDLDVFMRKVNDKMVPLGRKLKLLSSDSESRGIISSPDSIKANVADAAREAELCAQLQQVLDKESFRNAVKTIGRGKNSRQVLNIPVKQAVMVLESQITSSAGGLNALGGGIDEEE